MGSPVSPAQVVKIYKEVNDFKRVRSLRSGSLLFLLFTLQFIISFLGGFHNEENASYYQRRPGK